MSRVYHVGVRNEVAAAVNEPAGAGLHEGRRLDRDRPGPAVEAGLGIHPRRHQGDGRFGPEHDLLHRDGFVGKSRPRRPRERESGHDQGQSLQHYSHPPPPRPADFPVIRAPLARSPLASVCIRRTVAGPEPVESGIWRRNDARGLRPGSGATPLLARHGGAGTLVAWLVLTRSSEGLSFQRATVVPGPALSDSGELELKLPTQERRLNQPPLLINDDLYLGALSRAEL